MGKYKLLKTIGKGNFAKVKLARHIPTGQEVGLCIHSVHHGRGFTTCLTNVLVQTLIGIDCVCVCEIVVQALMSGEVVMYIAALRRKTVYHLPPEMPAFFKPGYGETIMLSYWVHPVFVFLVNS